MMIRFRSLLQERKFHLVKKKFSFDCHSHLSLPYNKMSEEKVKKYVQKYQNSDATRRDIIRTIRLYPGLRCLQDTFVFSNGTKKELANLSGTIPVTFRSKSYHFPVCLWLMDTHPNNPPICYVKPTPDMSIKPSQFIDPEGRIYSPYLHNWTSACTLVDLIQVLIKAFGETPPVYAKSKPDTSQNTPYPTQAYVQVQPMANTPYPIAGVAAPMPYAQPYAANPPPYPAVSGTASYPMANPQPGYPIYPSSMGAAAYPRMQQPMYPPVSSAFQGTASVVSTPQQTPLYPPYPTPTTAPSPQNTNTITDEHIRASLMSALEDKLRRKIHEQMAMSQDEIEILLQAQRELNDGKIKLDRMVECLKNDKANAQKDYQALLFKEAEIMKEIEKLSTSDTNEAEGSVVPATPLHKQIMNLVCEDSATEDTIYYVAEALQRGVIDIDVFMKQVRILSRKRFMLKALAEKCRIKAGLSA